MNKEFLRILTKVNQARYFMELALKDLGSEKVKSVLPADSIETAIHDCEDLLREYGFLPAFQYEVFSHIQQKNLDTVAADSGHLNQELMMRQAYRQKSEDFWWREDEEWDDAKEASHGN